MARLKIVCTSCTEHLVIWGTHDDLVVNLTTERLARAARCPTCGAILERWPVVQTSDKTRLTGQAVQRP